jgi:hypothetical protein
MNTQATVSTEQLIKDYAAQRRWARLTISTGSRYIDKADKKYYRGFVSIMGIQVPAIAYEGGFHNWFYLLRMNDSVLVELQSVFNSKKLGGYAFRAKCLHINEQPRDLKLDIERRQRELAPKTRTQLPLPGTGCQPEVIPVATAKDKKSKSKNNHRRVALTLRPDQEVFLDSLRYEEESSSDLIRRLIDYVAAHLSEFPSQIRPGSTLDTGLTGGHARARVAEQFGATPNAITVSDS